MNHSLQALRRAATLAAISCISVGFIAGASSTAQAAGVYFSRNDVLKSFFADSERVTYKRLEISGEQRRVLGKRLGYKLPDDDRVVFYGLRDGKVTGYAVIDDELGQHEPITFAVLISPVGKVERVEVMVYREPKGEAVRRAQFRDQFIGKGVGDTLRSGSDIAAISGATISSRSLSVGIKRAVVLVDALVIQPGLVPSQR